MGMNGICKWASRHKLCEGSKEAKFVIDKQKCVNMADCADMYSFEYWCESKAKGPIG
jgi:hypothetical protein